MKWLWFVLPATVLIAACHPRHPSDQPSETALKAAEKERARNNAEQDAIQLQSQLNRVHEREKKANEQQSPPKQ